MRCIACDKVLNEHECLARNPITKEPEDLCRVCINDIRKYEVQDEEPNELSGLWIVQHKLDNNGKPW